MKGVFDRIGFVIILVGYLVLIQRIGPGLYYETLYLINGKEIKAEVMEIQNNKSSFRVLYRESDNSSSKIYRSPQMRKGEYYIGEQLNIRITKYSDIAIHWRWLPGLYIFLVFFTLFMTWVALTYARRLFMSQEKR